jgi:3-dehydrosphinganine reductase
VFCVAGGTSEEIGFFADISAESIRACMEKNYFSSAFIANAMMKRWIAESSCRAEDLYPHHHLIFTSSTAALVAVPGYAAYAPTKAGIRALADILRMEALMYKSKVAINIHCSFPGTIYTESFFEEQKKKPELCKQIEGTVENHGGQSAGQIARKIIFAFGGQEYFITTDLMTRCLLSNMRGSSPPDAPFFDSILGFCWRLIWPFVRRHLDTITTRFGKKEKTK